MPSRREILLPPARIRAARLVDGNIQPLISIDVEPQVRAHQELLELWANLSEHGRKIVLSSARLAAQKEGSARLGASTNAVSAEVA